VPWECLGKLRGKRCGWGGGGGRLMLKRDIYTYIFHSALEKVDAHIYKKNIHSQHLRRHDRSHVFSPGDIQILYEGTCF